MTTSIQAFHEAIQAAERLVFFGGAGVSTASGIPDFRSAQGLFHQDTGLHYAAEEIISHDFFVQYPDLFFQYYRQHLIHPQAKANPAHQYLATLEEQGKNVTIITQNIDGLHQAAGSRSVIELHGSVWRNYCCQCGQSYDLADLVLDDQGIPRCPRDGGIVRPDVVLYQESLDQQNLILATAALAKADLVIVAGTSLMVYPAAGLIDYYPGSNLYLINKTPLDLNGRPIHFIQAPIETVFSQLQEKLGSS
ncbi:NAD-dependent protein deacylase [Vaginisenegalia massiliensis]|uniref:NAD-dependent protein deacylase n=1 Tax=Vaginisenegalia massiliensis TaxID=2058294 RepID=UPI000F52ACE9|nr:NAD-dependent protein deacylase [Vaginisenegalia massiliensis]